MERIAGEYLDGSLAGSRYKAYLPKPLPPDPPLDFKSSLVGAVESANQALGRLDGISLMLPDPNLFLYQYIRKEALLSSQIEGTQSSLSDLLLFELDEAPGVPVDDVEEVSNYVAALNHGLKRIREDEFPVSLRLIREIHAILLRGGRGSTRTPGEFRTTQNWIGGRTPSMAAFVPPPPDRLDDCLKAFERFLHTPASDLSPLLKAALAHVQFETIHPFNDGNGRMGRLLIALMLCADGVLREPSLYLSLYFKTQRQQYYDHLDNVRRSGDWESWLEFFLEGVKSTSQQAVQTAQKILKLFAEDREKVRTLGRRSGNALQVYEQFVRRPILDAPTIHKALHVAAPTVRAAIEALRDLNLLNEITGQRRNRVWVYQSYYALLSEGAAPL
jgi:Fic family protein